MSSTPLRHLVPLSFVTLSHPDSDPRGINSSNLLIHPRSSYPKAPLTCSDEGGRGGTRVPDAGEACADVDLVFLVRLEVLLGELRCVDGDVP